MVLVILIIFLVSKLNPLDIILDIFLNIISLDFPLKHDFLILCEFLLV